MTGHPTKLDQREMDAMSACSRIPKHQIEDAFVPLPHLTSGTEPFVSWEKRIALDAELQKIGIGLHAVPIWQRIQREYESCENILRFDLELRRMTIRKVATSFVRPHQTDTARRFLKDFATPQALVRR